MVKITRWGYKRVVSVERFGNVQVEAFGEVEDGEDPDDAFDALRRSVDLKVIERKMRIEGTYPDPDEQESSPSRASQFHANATPAPVAAPPLGQVKALPPAPRAPFGQGDTPDPLAGSRLTMLRRLSNDFSREPTDDEPNAVAGKSYNDLLRDAINQGKPLHLPLFGRVEIKRGTINWTATLYGEGDDGPELQSIGISEATARAIEADQCRGSFVIPDKKSGYVYQPNPVKVGTQSIQASQISDRRVVGQALRIPAGGKLEITSQPYGDAVACVFDGDGVETLNFTLDAKTFQTVVTDGNKGEFVVGDDERFEYVPSGSTRAVPWVQVKNAANEDGSGVARLEYMHTSKLPPRDVPAAFVADALARKLLVPRVGLPGLEFGPNGEEEFWFAHHRENGYPPNFAPMRFAYKYVAPPSPKQIKVPCIQCDATGTRGEPGDLTTCPDCDGAGAVICDETDACQYCGGDGQATDDDESECPYCDGSGYARDIRIPEKVAATA